jgi:hypothetical protein
LVGVIFFDMNFLWRFKFEFENSGQSRSSRPLKKSQCVNSRISALALGRPPASGLEAGRRQVPPEAVWKQVTQAKEIE